MPLVVHVLILGKSLTCNEHNSLSGIGLLKVNLDYGEAVTGLILIANSVCLANAYEISKINKDILRKSSKATFIEKDKTWDCAVKSYLLHPEFNKDTLSTIGLVYLDCKQIWQPINWPKFNTPRKEIYAVGLTDDSKELLSVIKYQMTPVNMNDCKDFYRRVEMNYKYLWPKKYLCFKSTLEEECIFEAGMALVDKYEENFTLIGLSIHGPGCSLPSRYIKFEPYIPWIQSQIAYKEDGRRNKEDSRRNDVTVIDPSSDIISDKYSVEDDFYITKLNYNTIVMKSAYAYIREVVYGDCLNNEGVMLYREAGLVRTQGKWATAVYALSLYDLLYNKITCVMVSVNCKKRSLTKFWYERGFHKDDMSDLIKIIPFPKRWFPVLPKILFLTDYYHKYDKITTANIFFKFEFRNEASINIDFYGTLTTTSRVVF